MKMSKSTFCVEKLQNVTARDASTEMGKWMSWSVVNGWEIINESGSFEDFTGWICEKVGLAQTDENLKKATYIAATFTILETAKHVFRIGSGFTKADINAFTIAQVHIFFME